MKYLSLQWHITEKCNNNCKHCYMEKESNDLSYNDLLLCYKRLLNFEKENGVFFNHISITGGNPLMYEKWYEFANLVSSDGKEISILGNPESLDRSNLKKLSGLNLKYYQMSLDGLEKTHDDIRKKGSFQRTVLGIKKLNDSNIPIAIMFTLSEKNKDELFPLIDYLDSLNTKIFFAFDFIVPIGNAKRNDLAQVFDMNAIFSNYLNKKKELFTKRRKLVLLEKSSFLKAYKFKNGIYDFNQFDKLEYDICSGCGATWNHFTILNNGNVCVCRRLPIVIGNLLKDPLSNVFFENEIVKDFQTKQNYKKCGRCKYYRFCRGCPAIEKAISGDCFGNKSTCMFFEKSNEEKNIANKKTLFDSIKNEPNNFISESGAKALLLLSFQHEKEEACKNFEFWKNKHNLNLSLHEEKLLFYYFLL